MAETADEEIREWMADREPFLRFLKEWERTWPTPKLADVIQEAGGPENTAIVCTDLTVAFTTRGRLASPRVAALVPPIIGLFKLAHALGIRTFVLTQDAHPPDSPEFRAYGPHAVPGTGEEETVPELKGLPFAGLFKVIPKQNLNPGIDTEFPSWLEEHPNVKLFIVVGDCTDLCVYQIAMYLRLRANQFKFDYEVVAPANCVDTFEISYETAAKLGIFPHDADFLHLLFLYHMALNDIRVVRGLG